MGLRETLSKAAQTAIVATGDIPVTTYFYSIGSTTYDTSTGVASVGSTVYVVSMIFTRFNTNEIMDENIEPTDQKGIIPQANISVIPKIDDYLQIVESGVSVRYDVVGKQKDPADAIWKLQLRRP